jgi:hypothetical protein
MESEQAKIILSAWRRGDATEGDALLEQALARMESDSELAEWFAGQQDFDDEMRSAMRSIEPPSHLRESILAAAKVVPIEPRRTFHPAWLAIAAGLVLAVGVAFFLIPRGNTLQLVTLKAQIPKLTAAHEHTFTARKGGWNSARAWLAKNGGAADFAFPPGLTALGGVECEVVSIEKVNVTILCFQAGDRRTTHLYVLDRSRLANPPPTGSPEMLQMGDFATASWSQGDRSYILAQRGSVAELSAFF